MPDEAKEKPRTVDLNDLLPLRGEEGGLAKLAEEVDRLGRELLCGLRVRARDQCQTHVLGEADSALRRFVRLCRLLS